MKIIRDARVAEIIGAKSRATPWRKAKSDPTFPKPVVVSAGITGWVESEVVAWVQARIDAQRSARRAAHPAQQSEAEHAAG